MSDSLLQRVAASLAHQYAVEREIGRGGMSVVYRARDVRLNRTVAIKVLPPEMAYDPAIRMRFTREAQTSAQLTHAHIVPIYDVGERDGIAYFVMAFIEGGSVADLLAREPRPPVEETRRLLREIADALAYAHVHGVIHRDIKPDNILLYGETGRSTVTDFGIARAMEAGARLTVTGNAVGTPTYMSPEQAMGEREVDGRSDLYALGVLGYQMLTGRVPFTASNPMALLLKHVSDTPQPIAELRPDVPRALREAVERAMAKSPDDRWPSAAALRDALAGPDASSTAWRSESREPVRYLSPRPVSRSPVASRRAPTPGVPVAAPGAPATPAGLVMEAPHLVPLTREQRDDLLLWHGHVNLLDRVKEMRRYLPWTLLIWIASAGGIAGAAEGAVPLALAPLIPMYMSRKLFLRGRSLRASGLRLWRVFLMPRARQALREPTVGVAGLTAVAPRELLEGPHGATLRRAAEDRAAIVALLAGMSKADRKMLPDLAPALDALVKRVAELAAMLHRLGESIDPRQAAELDDRIALVQREAATPEGERRLGLLERQRATLEELVQRRATLGRQLDSAGLALGNLRLDLVKLRSSGLQSAFSDVTSATQEVRALSRDIDVMMHAAAEVKAL